MPRLTLRTTVAADDAGRALAPYLATRFRYLSQAQWCARIGDGSVLVDGRRADPEQPLPRGAEIAYTADHREPPAPTEVPVLLDAGGVVAVDKPAGLPAHADGAFITRTLVAVVRERLAAKLWLVQRLDRETSGACLLARDRATTKALGFQLERGAIGKIYLAVARGLVEPEQFDVDRPLARATHGVTLRRVASSDGEPARTSFAVLARGDDCTLLQCRPHTGRTHQIRAHLDAVGHPLVGDKLYGQSDATYLEWVAHVKAGGDPGWDGRLGADRHLLHAAELRFLAPDSGQPVCVRAPVADDLRAFVTARGLACPP